MGSKAHKRNSKTLLMTDKNGLKDGQLIPYVNVNVKSRTALIRNRVSRRVFHVSRSRVGVLYLFQEAQAH